jgi:hypothetical protein
MRKQGGPRKRRKVEKLRYVLALAHLQPISEEMKPQNLFSLFSFLFLVSLALFSYLLKNYRHFAVLLF